MVVMTQRRPAELDVPKPPVMVPAESTAGESVAFDPPSAQRVVQRAAFFDAEVTKRIEQTDMLNREATERCLRRLRGVFQGYRRGVSPFVEDLTSIRTRLGIARRMPSDWWNDDKRIEHYIKAKFEKHLFSEKSLVDDVAAILQRFRDEVDANQRRMLVEIKASLELADLPEVDVDRYDSFLASVAQRMKGYSADQGTSSIYNAVVVLVISEAGSYAAVSVIAGLLARFGTTAAVSTAAGAGATAGGAAAGAGGGSVLGPAGTVVGLGVGLAVGLVIDWWMTERFEAEMTEKMTAYMRSLEASMIQGSQPDRTHEPSSAGLAIALPRLCDGLKEAYRENFYEQIVVGEAVQ